MHAQPFLSACLAELAALKPGNVHAMADGHGMTVEQFVISAELSAPYMQGSHLSVGQRILQAAQATWQAVGCNTNLGILLLCAPIAHACCAEGGHFSEGALQVTLRALSLQDAADAYQAIALMSPAGLGRVDSQDVASHPTVNLLQAMRLASEYDMVARQYAEEYQDVLSLGVPTFVRFSEQWQKSGWAVTAVYLAFMANYLDSHIVRKFGREVAQQVQQEAMGHQRALSELENPKTYFKALLAWDADLKQRGINPGTSADLTVASLFILALQGVNLR